MTILSVLLVISLVISAIVVSLAIVCLPPISLGVVAAVHPDHTPTQAAAQRQIAKGALASVTLGTFEMANDAPLWASEKAYHELGIQQFSLDEVRHLVDVRHTIVAAWIAGGIALLASVFCFIKLSSFRTTLSSFWACPRIHIGASEMVDTTRKSDASLEMPGQARHDILKRPLRIAGWICVGLPVTIALALVAAFDWFFTLFHNVLYPQGNWQFAMDSALISSFPEQYWSTMGLLWMLIIVLIGITFLLLSRRRKEQRIITARD